jgi:hypothetical protein
MADSVELLFGIQGSEQVAARVRAMSSSFKGLERNYRNVSKLGKLANATGGALSAASAIGAGRGLGQLATSLLTPENMNLLSRYITRPIALDFRRLNRAVKPKFEKVKDSINELSKKLMHEIVASRAWTKMQLLKTAAKSSILKTAAAVYAALKLRKGAELVGKGTEITIRTVSRTNRRLKLIERRLQRAIADMKVKRALSQNEYRIERRKRIDAINVILRRRGKKDYGRGPVAVAARKTILVGRRATRAIGGLAKSSISFLSAFVKNPYVLIAAGIVAAASTIAILVDRRLAPVISKIVNWVSNLVSTAVTKAMRYTAVGLQTIAYTTRRLIEQATGKDLGSKYSAPDLSPELIQKMNDLKVTKPEDIHRMVEENIKGYAKKFETNLEDYKKNVLDAVNEQSKKRLSSIDDLLFTQAREARI